MGGRRPRGHLPAAAGPGDVLHYAFRLTLSDDTDVIEGETKLAFRVPAGRDLLDLDLAQPKAETAGRGMTVAGVSESGEPLQLNPVDKIWFYTKYNRLSNYAPSTLNELRRRMIQEFIDLQNKPNVLAWCIRETGLSLKTR